MQRDRHEEFIRFLNDVECEVPPRKTTEAIAGNYTAHKHPNLGRVDGFDQDEHTDEGND